jgi:hypothetical protein
MSPTYNLWEAEMPLRTLQFCAAVVVLSLLGTSVLHGQAAVEYGVMTGSSATAAASSRGIPFPNVAGALSTGSSPSAAPAPGSGPAGVPSGTAEAAAKTNLDFFQSHAGPNAGTVAVHTSPDKANVWVDGKFLGPAALNLKLAPGHHQLLVRAPNMHEYLQEFDVTAKQAQSFEVAMKSAYQSQVVVHWPAQK